MKNSISNTIKQKIISKGRAKFWFIDDFVAIGNNESVRKALQQLALENLY